MPDPEPIGRSLPEAIALASAAVDHDHTAFMLSCVLVEKLTPTTIRCVATSGHILAVVEADGGDELAPQTPFPIHPDSIKAARDFARRLPKKYGGLAYRAKLTAEYGPKRCLITDERMSDACMLRRADGEFPAYHGILERETLAAKKRGFKPGTGINWRLLQLVERILGRSAAIAPFVGDRGNIFRGEHAVVMVMPISLPNAETEAA